MSNAPDWLMDLQEAQGWSDSTVLDLLLTYIGNQHQDDALQDFMQRAADEENLEAQ